MEYLNKQDYKFGYLQENIEMIVYSFVCFFVPFFIGHPQLVVGIIVNASLVLAALNLRSYKLLPVIILPSLAVLSRGIIFGPFIANAPNIRNKYVRLLITKSIKFLRKFNALSIQCF